MLSKTQNHTTNKEIETNNGLRNNYLKITDNSDIDYSATPKLPKGMCRLPAIPMLEKLKLKDELKTDRGI